MGSVIFVQYVWFRSPLYTPVLRFLFFLNIQIRGWEPASPAWLMAAALRTWKDASLSCSAVVSPAAAGPWVRCQRCAPSEALVRKWMSYSLFINSNWQLQKNWKLFEAVKFVFTFNATHIEINFKNMFGSLDMTHASSDADRMCDSFLPKVEILLDAFIKVFYGV